LCVLLAIGSALHPGLSPAVTSGTQPIPKARQLEGLSPEEATTLLAELEKAQRRLRTGEFQTFELLAGSVASYEATKISPRKAFLSVPFQKVWKIDRVRVDDSLWQPYRFAYAPNGLGQIYWDIEVMLNSAGEIERVTMIYKPPPPF